MYTLDFIKKHITDLLNQILEGVEVDIKDLTYPPNSEYGDLSLPCFGLAQTLKMSPGEIADFLVGKIKSDEIISDITTAGPYANFFINKKYLAKNVIEEIKNKNENYGANNQGEGYKIIIEYSNANTHKEYHIGHLRNISYGDAINRILANNGYTTIPVSYINDFGIHVAKTLWNYHDYVKNNYKSEENLEKMPAQEKGASLGKMYADATTKEKDSPIAKQMINRMMKKIASRQGEEYKLWKKTRQWNIKQFENIYQELGVKFKKTYYEHEFIDKGIKKVKELLEQKVLTKSKGAIIANLEDYKLGVLVFIRSDGTAMYPVADLALAEQKIKEYKADQSIYIVDVRQNLYFKQLFKILELVGYKQNLVHLPFNFVKLPEGMMSSRSGDIITYEELKNKVFEQSREETQKRHPDWSRNKINTIAKIIALGTIKFEMLKVEASRIITFDIKQALSFEGFTSAYIQYSFARINSVLEKSGEQGLDYKQINFSKLEEEKEKQLLLKLAKYPEIIQKASNNYGPNEIAKFLFDLTKTFNDYYHNISILQNNPKIRMPRLILVSATAQIIKNGLNVLGIQTTKEM